MSDDVVSSGFYKRPSEIKAQIERKVQEESRSDDVKSKEFMQVSKKRSQDVPSFSKRPSHVKAGWEARVEEENRADDIKAREFTQGTGWSKKRAQDVPSFAEKPSQVKGGIEANVEKESKSDDVKARSYLKKTVKEHSVPRILTEPSHVKEGIEANVEKERASHDEKARNFLEETTYRGVEARKFKTTLIPLSVLFSKPHKDQVRISPNGTYLAWRTRGRSMGDPNEEDNGVRNIFVKKRETSTIRQITFYNELDACVYFTFTPDDKSIVFLRETKRGSESYHLYAIEINPFFDQDDEKADDPSSPPPAQPRNLIKDPNMTCGIGFVGGIQMWTSSESPRHIFVSTSEIGPYAMFWDISRVNIDTAELSLVEKNIMSSKWGMIRVVIITLIARILSLCCIKIRPPGVPIQWFPDDQLLFRGRMEVNFLDLGASFCARSRKNGKWKTLHACSFEDTNLQLVGSSGGSGTARMEFSSNGGDQVDIHLCAFKTGGKTSDTTTYDRFNVNTGQYLKRVAGGNAKSDITGFVAHPETGRAQFVYYEWEKIMLEVIPGTDSDTVDWRKTGLEDDIQYIRSYFQPSMTFQIVSRANSDDAWVLFAENDTGASMFKGSPSAYFLFTRSTISARQAHGSSFEAKRNMELIFPSRPEMKKYKLARMDPVHCVARDGKDIMCYLSHQQALPSIKGRQPEPPGPPPPLIMVIHGGPQARDSWGYNPLCQFLCSRGFRVLQVNYRGSTGFGARFLRLGMNGEFYKSVQTDIADAAKYATSNSDTESADDNADIPPLPWGDSDQLAILGGSFGGYSALWGITSTNPGLYKCAVAICPISSVGAANDQSKKAFGGSPLIAKYWQRVFGKDVSKKKRVAMKASPMYQIDKVGKGSTIALYHGENDRRAPIEHSYNMMKELKRCGIAGELVTFTGEGHGMSKEANVLYMYYRIEEFLCKKFGMGLFDAGEDTKKFEQNTAKVKWSAEYAEGNTDI
mmetsp:Transcript_3170/g.5779  ORF Transcript_3170/g.5779 Transcript_3170/m.5779 type:complete len:978 (-) Transcript_3170:1051-3984(-)|eukprot:CAMPEP_0201916790 /NCGR_PEP_ID=MMETSP0903-20130614/6349_1 /ASSEMBLY_ACC=CAM_ASM_000552 /TAXON_ID=420261 /ORGANISM="Thalassiosira antarctica, Strain CCMP982" /LENGTH=977 /DNA_ID=CAMNT_0048452713 /DNA_START=190 /DNA_END=3123 /DNA_ORIENTATION=+